MQLPQNFKSFTVDELKVIAWDNLVEIEGNQANLKEINLILKEKTNLPTQDTPVPANG